MRTVLCVMGWVIAGVLPLREARAQSVCEVRDERVSVPAITVHPRGAPPFALALDARDVTFHMFALPTPHAEVRVNGTVNFLAWAQLDAVGWTFRSAPVFADGVLRIGEGAVLEQLRVDARGVRGDVVLGDGTRVETLSIPCEVINPGAPRVTAAQRDLDPTARSLWVPARANAPVVIRATPTAVQGLTVTGPLMLTRVQEQGVMMLVEQRWTDGSRVRGWVNRGELNELIPNAETFRPVGVTPTQRVAPPCAGTLGAGDRVVHATVLAGGLLFAPNAGAWATVRVATEGTVVLTRGRDHARVVELPGLRSPGGCGALEHAFVPVSRVRVPRATAARAAQGHRAAVR